MEWVWEISSTAIDLIVSTADKLMYTTKAAASPLELLSPASRGGIIKGRRRHHGAMHRDLHPSPRQSSAWGRTWEQPGTGWRASGSGSAGVRPPGRETSALRPAWGRDNWWRGFHPGSRHQKKAKAKAKAKAKRRREAFEGQGEPWEEPVELLSGTLQDSNGDLRETEGPCECPYRESETESERVRRAKPSTRGRGFFCFCFWFALFFGETFCLECFGFVKHAATDGKCFLFVFGFRKTLPKLTTCPTQAKQKPATTVTIGQDKVRRCRNQKAKTLWYAR